ncbi:hypothetical protein LG329_12125 [Virgibacillus necropolis]|uniref:hypothetical protein n=1 Tax=Virgibacillus necropolis TaxID=163877 RepID=UPI00384D3F6A
MLAWFIVACEIGFWIFVLAGLVARYVFHKKKLGAFLLICTPIVDVLLLIAAVIDLKNGAVATTVHGIAAIYIGVSVAFGHQMIKWADIRFAYRFGNGPRPDKSKKYGKDFAKKERTGWYHHLIAWIVGVIILGAIILYIDNQTQTEALYQTARLWTLVLGVDFLISFSYTIFPRKDPRTS